MNAPDPEILRMLPLISFADQSTTAIRTGSWKYLEPRYEDKLPPCSHACPAGNDISTILAVLATGDTARAARLLRASNPLPATLGRVCPHFCERQCNRESFGGAIAVHMIERFLGDYSLRNEVLLQPLPRSGQKVAIIGAGPAGITAAYSLSLAGHEVEVFDEKPRPGGYLRTGIPDYRLPKEILDGEIRLAERVGVKFTQNTRVGRDISFGDLKCKFNAVIVAVGLHRSHRLGIPGGEHPRVYDGVELLERILAGENPEIPANVAVIGGGNTAIDVARSLLRLGAKPVIVYRRTEAEMPAIASEVREAKQEGVAFRFLEAPSSVVIKGDAVVALECRKMRLGDPDQSGRRSPVPIPNSEFRIPVSAIVSAIGETVDLGFLPDAARDGKLAATRQGVFITGDASTREGTVTAAVGSGRRVAAVVHRFLSDGGWTEEEPMVQSLWQRRVNLLEVADLKHLNPAYFQPEPRPEEAKSNVGTPPNSFAEVVQGFSAESALREARRCLACGTCNGCLNCYYWCPDVAIHRNSKADLSEDAAVAFTVDLHIDSDHCKGCGICVEECPRGAMVLEEVSR